MTSLQVPTGTPPVRQATPRRYLMCPPTHFAVTYEINAWMDVAVPVDVDLAVRQWRGLVDAYRAAGHQVEVLPAPPGLPDAVFAANGATVVDGRVLVARFAHPERSAEAQLHASWHRTHPTGRGTRATGATVVRPVAVNEAEGDFAVLSGSILAGYGFRTSRAAHRELAALTGRRVVSLELVDPRFYHLDVALTVLDDRTDHIAYYPPAFSAESRAELERLFPDAVIATTADAYAFGLNAVSDGLRVFLPLGADHLAAELEAARYQVVPIDLSELRKGGGSVKCCTQELRPAPTPVRSEPTPVRPEPTPFCPEPTSTRPEPTPMRPEPTPVRPEPTPMRPEPVEGPLHLTEEF